MASQQVTVIKGANISTSMLEESAIQEFKAVLRGPLIRPGEAGYEDARTIWNGMIDKRPALIACCSGVADVIESVNFARAHDLLVAVRAGGHNIAGNATCDGGLMINLSSMKGLRVDPAHKTARAEPGLIWAEFDHETQAFGLATTGGQISTTGIAGLTLGGGWGYLARQYGLASDNLLSADVVTADGRLLTASATEHDDLFWGLRGGGGNFGIVTSLEYRLYPVGKVLAGLVAFPIEKTKDVLKFFRDFTSGVLVITLPDGPAIAGIGVCYSGSLDEGERILEPLRTFGTPLIDQIGPMPYSGAQKMIDGLYPSGNQSYWKSNFFKEISDGAIDTITAYCAKRPFPLCHCVIEHQLGGAVSRIDTNATAFNHRDVQQSFLCVGECTTQADADSCVRWAREFWQAMQPYSTGAVYVNYLGQEADEGAERLKAAYGPQKYQRLAALKKKYDPTNLFRLNQNIKPAA
jgi:hypothetical protein